MLAVGILYFFHVPYTGCCIIKMLHEMQHLVKVAFRTTPEATIQSPQSSDDVSPKPTALSCWVHPR